MNEEKQPAARKTVTLLMGVVGIIVVAAFLLSNPFCKKATAICHAFDPQNQVPAAVPKQLAPGYSEYSASAVVEAHQAGKKVVLYFWAPWCTSCSSLDLEIDRDPTIIPSDTIVFQVPYDTATDLKKQYGIVTQHTFVIVAEDGTALATWVGGSTAELQDKL